MSILLMGRQSALQSSSVHRVVSHSPDSKHALLLFRDIIKSAYGPCGKIVTLQNGCGGHVTMTSSCDRLLKSMSIENPFIQVIASSVQTHLSSFQDGGLFTALLCTELIINSMESNFTSRFLIDIYNKLLELSVSYIESSDCRSKHCCDVGNLNVMLCLSRTILASKPMCGLYGETLDRINRLFMSAFLNSIPEIGNLDPDNLIILTKSGCGPDESKLFKGVLFDIHSAILGLDGVTSEGKADRLVAVVTASMSGDSSDLPMASYEIDDEISSDELFLKHLYTFCDDVIDTGAHILLCQKVVHPDIRQYLWNSGVFVIDRLGSEKSQQAIKLTGAVPIPSIHVSENLTRDYLGHINMMSLQTIQRQRYLLLTRDDAPIQTILLCHYQEETLEEFKVVFKKTMNALHRYIQQPEVLFGGGCWQNDLSMFITNKVKSTDTMLLITEDLHCTTEQVKSVVRLFTTSLQHTVTALHPDNPCVTDSSHVWRIPPSHWSMEQPIRNNLTCGCGLRTYSDKCLPLLSSVYEEFIGRTDCELVSDKELFERIKKEHIVLDLLSVSLSAFRLAVMTAVSVLGISQYIKDVN